MTNLSETLSKHIEAANVLVLAGKIEDNLEKLLLVAGREIPNKVAKRIFAGMGPLSSLAGKIEVAYLFELIDEPAFKDLLIIKDVRNAFAHTTQYVYFSQEHIAAKCRNLSNWIGDPQDAFYKRGLELFDEISDSIDKLIFRKALQEAPLPVVDEEE
ncbi:hypothetical protein [Bradyrhizobium sp. UNPA324]|uniref:hypothetical protein n=1 Tax=Bradyrhizobium sp. UNPA324 TaxID=1141174 RepID=UPI001153264E|nr:hypothetical protein [Bradyrhizobium sp. UNPA324]TQF28790.1 hypothetical protein UNPA324_03335 [Bradyrhizobium sp. UNPA324]